MRQRTVIVLVVVLAGVLWLLARFGGSSAELTTNATDVAREDASDTAQLAQTVDAPEQESERALVPDATQADVAAPSEAEAFGVLRIDVTWGEDGTPAADVNVDVSTADEHEFVEGRTDERGTFLLAHAAVGPCSAQSDRSAKAGAYARGEVRAGEETLLRLSIAPDIDLEGIVVDGTGEPVAQAQIWLSSLRRGLDGHRVALSDSQGTFRVRAVDEQAQIEARKAGYPPSDRHWIKTAVLPGEMRARMTLVLEGPGAALLGTVVDAAGKPVAGAVVRTGEYVKVRMDSLAGFPLITRTTADGTMRSAPMPPALKTDAAGEFRDDCVALGELALCAQAAGHAAWIGSVEIRPHELNRATIRLPAPIVLEGSVRDTSAQPVAGARITALGESVFTVAQATADEHGDYRLEGLWPGEIRLQANGPPRAQVGSAQHTLLAVAGAHLRWDVQLPSTASIAGRALDEHDAPLAGWLVSAYHEDWWQARRAKCDADGRFEFKGLEALPHVVELRRPGEDDQGLPAAWARDVLPGGAPLELRALTSEQSLCRIDGRVLDAQGAPVVAARVHAFHRAARRDANMQTDHAGAFALAALPAGTFDVHLYAPQHPRKRLGEHVLAPGDVLHLGDIVLTRPGTLRVRVTRPQGAALAGLQGVVDGTHGDVDLEPQQGGMLVSPPLEAGAWALRVRADGAAPQRMPVSVESGRETVVDLSLAPGVQRTFRLSSATPPGSHAWLTVRDAAGEELASLVRENTALAQSLDFAVCLGTGAYDVTGHWSHDVKGAARVEFADLAPSSAPIEIRALQSP